MKFAIPEENSHSAVEAKIKQVGWVAVSDGALLIVYIIRHEALSVERVVMIAHERHDCGQVRCF